MIYKLQFQGVCVFIFYVVLNDQVKSRWIALLKPQQAQNKSGVPSCATKSKSAATKSTAISAATKSPASRSTAVNAKVTTTEINLELEEMTSAGREDNSPGKNVFPAVEEKIADI